MRLRSRSGSLSPLLVGLLLTMGLLGGCIDPPIGGDGYGTEALEPAASENATPLLRVPVHVHVETATGPDPDLPFWSVTYTRAAEPEPLDTHEPGPFGDEVEAPYGYVEGEPGEVVTVMVDGGFSHTSETFENVRIDDALVDSGLHLVIYRTELILEWNATLDVVVEPTTSRWVGGQTYWAPQEVRLHDDPEVNRAYLDRLIRFAIAMEWENSATQHADLGIGIGFSPDRLEHVLDNDENPGPGTWREHLAADVYDHPLLAEATSIYIGPVSHEPIVSPADPVEANFVLKLEFGEPPSGPGTPGPGIAVLLLGIVASLGVVARRRGSM